MTVNTVQAATDRGNLPRQAGNTSDNHPKPQVRRRSKRLCCLAITSQDAVILV